MREKRENKTGFFGVLLALYSGLFLIHITITYMVSGESFPITFFKATGITSILIMWLYGFDKLK